MNILYILQNKEAIVTKKNIKNNKNIANKILHFFFTHFYYLLPNLINLTFVTAHFSSLNISDNN